MHLFKALKLFFRPAYTALYVFDIELHDFLSSPSPHVLHIYADLHRFGIPYLLGANR
ncbi:hypothetical protein D3C77_325260 [compost metagenome]